MHMRRQLRNIMGNLLDHECRSKEVVVQSQNHAHGGAGSRDQGHLQDGEQDSPSGWEEIRQERSISGYRPKIWVQRANRAADTERAEVAAYQMTEAYDRIRKPL